MKIWLAALSFLYFLPSVTQAQVEPCRGGGPGPGYRVVGKTQAGNGVASILLCEPIDQGRQEQAPEPRPTPTVTTKNYFAFAYHPDARQVWAVIDYPIEAEARNDAVTNCTKTMGEGCLLAGSGTNTAITIFEVSDGSIAWVPYHDPKDARTVLMSCKTQVRPLNCYPRHYFGAYNITTNVGTLPRFSRQAINPVGTESLRKVYGSVALAAANSALDNNKIWVSTGHKTQAEATNAALGLCAKATGANARNCKTGITIATGVIRVLLSPDKVISFTSDIDPALTWEYFEKECTAWKEPTKCMPKYLFDVQKPGQFEKIVQ
jgi:hypothetical protein